MEQRRIHIHIGIDPRTKPLIPLNTLMPHDPRCTVFNTAPRRLSHYTSIETLELILKNRTIRFNRLDNVNRTDRANDANESLSSNYKTAQSMVFASCWTAAELESDLHWNRYAGGYQGVRITMPTLMFNGRHNNHKVTHDDRHYEITVDPVNRNGCLYQIERRGKQVMGLAGSGVSGPTKINYVSAEDAIQCNVIQRQDGTMYDLRSLGTVKLKEWECESEYRFRILSAFGYSKDDSGEKWMSPSAFEDSPVVTESIDVPLDPSALEEMEIMLGPKSTENDLRRVEQLCKEYAAKAVICRSNVAMR